MTAHLHYWVVFILMFAGLYLVMASSNLVKKVVGLSLFQTSIFVFFIALGKVEGGSAPIYEPGFEEFSNPLTHVLILTAIVVSIATTSLALALVVRIRESFGTIEDDQLADVENQEQ
ncbi:cation:proton antiporter subunit C [Gammaproteobacteria bacterium]|nr:cation:proton antiporter subunit C [Gammaproteobacteria bacterium]